MFVQRFCFVILAIISVEMASAQNCGQEGSCTGDSFLLDIIPQVDQVICRDRCVSYDGPNAPCTNYTQCKSDCFIFANCLGIEPTTDCHNGQAECKFCNVVGFCQGSWLSASETVDIGQCWSNCQQDARCMWYEFDTQSTINCFLYEKCENYSPTNCLDCIVGERNCPSTKKIIVIQTATQ